MKADTFWFILTYVSIDSFFQGNPRKVTAPAREQINNIANDFIRGVAAYVGRNEAEGK